MKLGLRPSFKWQIQELIIGSSIFESTWSWGAVFPCTENKHICYVLAVNIVFWCPDFQIVYMELILSMQVWSIINQWIHRSVSQSIHQLLLVVSDIINPFVNQQSETLVVIGDYEQSARILIEEMPHAWLHFYLHGFFSD